MKKTITLSFFIFSHLIIFGQVEFSPPGAEWCYKYSGGFGPGGNKYLKYTGDTIVQGKQCKILSGELQLILNQDSQQVLQQQEIIFQKEDSIFTLHPFWDDFEFKFRYNLEVGDTVHFPLLNGEVIEVANLDSVLSGNTWVKLYHLESTNPVYPETILYPRAGPQLGYFENWSSFIFDGTSHYLSWYKDDEVPLIGDGGTSCFLPTPVNELLNDDGVSIFPNPVETELNLIFQKNDLEIIDYQIFNSAGKLMANKTESFFNNKIVVSDFPNGSYILLLETPKGFYPLKFIKEK